MLFKKRDKKQATKEAYNKGGKSIFVEQTEPVPKGKVPFKSSLQDANTIGREPAGNKFVMRDVNEKYETTTPEKEIKED
jgi:hypothetical protein